METRNIIDHYHYWATDAIKANLDTKRGNYSIVCCNIGNDFNIATVIRNANAFLAKEVIIYGTIYQENWKDSNGNARTSYEVNAESIAITTYSVSKQLASSPALAESISDPWAKVNG